MTDGTERDTAAVLGSSDLRQQTPAKLAAAPVEADRRRSAVRRAGKAVLRGYGMATSPLRPLPDFIIIGCKRGGTTSLYRYLRAHPRVLHVFPSARRLPMAQETKGAHYFDVEYARGETWYRAHFPSAIYRGAVERRLGAPTVVGEASPYYLFHPRAAARAAADVPHSKIIVLLRDPVARAFSHYKEQRRNGVETLSFEAALEAEPQRLAGERERLLRDDRARSFAHEHQSYVAQGRYLPALLEWTGRFDRDRVLVVRSEDFFTAPQAEYDRVLAFLGLPSHRLHNPQVWNATPQASLPPPVRRWLREQLADDTRALERYLGRPLGWDA